MSDMTSERLQMTTSGVSSVLGASFASISPAILPPGSRDSIQAMRSVNQAGLFGADQELTFAVDPATRTLVFRLVNTDTHEVIRQIPSEVLMNLRETLK
jgi:hypothetical protein